MLAAAMTALARKMTLSFHVPPITDRTRRRRIRGRFGRRREYRSAAAALTIAGATSAISRRAASATAAATTTAVAAAAAADCSFARALARRRP